MKKNICTIIIACAIMCFVACGNSQTGDSNTNSADTSQNTAADSSMQSATPADSTLR